MTAVVVHPGIVGSPTPMPHPTPALLQTWTCEDDTAAFAQRLAALPGVRHAFIELHGDLGAGKTTFVRHLLRALGVSGRIKSPTYAVVEPHEVGQEAQRLRIWHFDFYRFNDPREWEDAGFRDLFASPGLKLAEWPEKAASVLPPADLVLNLRVLADTEAASTTEDLDEAPPAPRELRLQAGTALGRELLEALRA
ncbi:tRNA (adenosine(37)-N6)-threonylcarbamoyltransferase complex ATPase subunit type 1 TsaE [Curvibacter microcysteis]